MKPKQTLGKILLYGSFLATIASSYNCSSTQDTTSNNKESQSEQFKGKANVNGFRMKGEEMYGVHFELKGQTEKFTIIPQDTTAEYYFNKLSNKKIKFEASQKSENGRYFVNEKKLKIKK
ncbi:MAG: hypothetical protein ACLFNM_01425 [Candidatus Woesearchaeota archaeon]